VYIIIENIYRIYRYIGYMQIKSVHIKYADMYRIIVKQILSHEQL